MDNYFSFRKLISIDLIKLIYFLGILYLIGTGGYLIWMGDNKSVLSGFGLIIIGNIFWRLMCESWILFFSMHNILLEISNSLVTTQKPNENDLICNHIGQTGDFCTQCGIDLNTLEPKKCTHENQTGKFCTKCGEVLNFKSLE